MFLLIKGCGSQVHKNLMQVFFIITSWYLWSGKGFLGCLYIPTSILNLTNYFGNGMELLNHSRFMVSCTHPKLSLRLITSFKNLLQSWNATFQGLCLALCSPLMALSSHLSALLYYGLSYNREWIKRLKAKTFLSCIWTHCLFGNGK